MSANWVRWHTQVMSYNPCPVMRRQSESQSEHEAPLDDQLWLIKYWPPWHNGIYHLLMKHPV
jgi:hypothetical protein